MSSNLSGQPFFSLISHHREVFFKLFPFSPQLSTLAQRPTTVLANRTGDPLSQNKAHTSQVTTAAFRRSGIQGDLWFPSRNSPFSTAGLSSCQSLLPAHQRPPSRGFWNATKTTWQVLLFSGPIAAHLRCQSSAPSLRVWSVGPQPWHHHSASGQCRFFRFHPRPAQLIHEA